MFSDFSLGKLLHDHTWKLLGGMQDVVDLGGDEFLLGEELVLRGLPVAALCISVVLKQNVHFYDGSSGLVFNTVSFHVRHKLAQLP